MSRIPQAKDRYMRKKLSFQSPAAKMRRGVHWGELIAGISIETAFRNIFLRVNEDIQPVSHKIGFTAVDRQRKAANVAAADFSIYLTPVSIGRTDVSLHVQGMRSSGGGGIRAR